MRWFKRWICPAYWSMDEGHFHTYRPESLDILNYTQSSCSSFDSNMWCHFTLVWKEASPPEDQSQSGKGQNVKPFHQLQNSLCSFFFFFKKNLVKVKLLKHRSGQRKFSKILFSSFLYCWEEEKKNTNYKIHLQSHYLWGLMEQRPVYEKKWLKCKSIRLAPILIPKQVWQIQNPFCREMKQKHSGRCE